MKPDKRERRELIRAKRGPGPSSGTFQVPAYNKYLREMMPYTPPPMRDPNYPEWYQEEYQKQIDAELEQQKALEEAFADMVAVTPRRKAR